MLEWRFWHDYAPLFKREDHWNWVDFTFLNLAVERTYYVDRFEFHVGLLGLHMNVDYLWGDMKKDRREADKNTAHTKQETP